MDENKNITKRTRVHRTLFNQKKKKKIKINRAISKIISSFVYVFALLMNSTQYSWRRKERKRRKIKAFRIFFYKLIEIAT